MQTLKDWIGAALLAAAICAGTIASNEARAQAAAPTLLDGWTNAQYQCASAPLVGARTNPACMRRDAFAKSLTATGWTQAEHDVWISQADVGNVQYMVMQLDERRNLREIPVMLEAFAANYLRQLGTPPERLVAVWRLQSAEYRDRWPYGWAVMSELVDRVSAAHRGDPRFAMDE